MAITNIDWTNRDHRVRVIEEMVGHENSCRKEQSIKEVDVYRGIIRPYVQADLVCQHGLESANEIPIVSSVNVAKRVVDNDSKLYSTPVKREFEGVTDAQAEALNLIYDDMKIDNQLLRSNRYFNLQQQNIFHTLPKNGKLITRVYKMHQIDAIPMYMNPERAQSFIISNFDRSLFDQVLKSSKGDGQNQTIADYDDAILEAMIFAVWDLEYQFIMNGKGEVLGDEVESLTPGHLPFADIHGEKDFTFFVEFGNELVDFTISYNSALSNEAQIVKMQGFSQPYLKGPSSLFSKDMKIGPDRLLKLPTDNIDGSEQVEFGYANPSTDLKGVREHRVEYLNDFLSTREIPKGKFEGSATYSSGVERLLAMVKDFERSREAMAIFANAEDQLFETVRLWHNTALGTDLLDKKYLAGSKIPETATVKVTYKKPEMIKTEEESIRTRSMKIESGLSSKVMEIMEEHKIEESEAIEKFKKILEHEELEIGEATEKPNPDEGRSFTNIQS